MEKSLDELKESFRQLLGVISISEILSNHEFIERPKSVQALLEAQRIMEFEQKKDEAKGVCVDG